MLSTMLLLASMSAPEVKATSDYCAETYSEYHLHDEVKKVKALGSVIKLTESQSKERKKLYSKLIVDGQFNGRGMIYCIKTVGLGV